MMETGNMRGATYRLLMAQAIENGRGGTRADLGMKERGAAIDGALSQVAAAQPREKAVEECSGVRLAWVNPAMRQGAKRKTSAPWLMVVS